jgi:hypothetical protein
MPPLAIWLGSDSQLTVSLDNSAAIWTSTDKWAEGSMGLNFLESSYRNGIILDPLLITSFALSMAVNAMMTTSIVIKILKVFLEVKSSTGDTKLRHVVFIIIESGMALFAIQLVRVVLSCLQLSPSTTLAFNLTIGINQMFNVIIISVHFSGYIFCFANNIYLARASHQH